MKFKIGDRVKVISGKFKGQVGVAQYINDSYVFVLLDDRVAEIYITLVELVVKSTEYFDGVQVGDKVYSVAYGDGIVNNIENGIIKATFRGFYSRAFSTDGIELPNCPQTLFWSKPEFKIPEKPKRKVKRAIEGWINIYPGDYNWKYGVGQGVYKSKEDADMIATDNRIGEAIFIKHEYEVEE